MVQVVNGITLLEHLDKNDICGYWQEFRDRGETDNVLFQFCPDNVDEYCKQQATDQKTKRFGFFAYDVTGKWELVGMVRISQWLNYEESGKIGYSIRPSKRGRGYATDMLKLAGSWCRNHGIEPATACVDVRNVASIRALRAAGFTETGRSFDWVPNPEPRKAIEFALRSQ